MAFTEPWAWAVQVNLPKGASAVVLLNIAPGVRCAQPEQPALGGLIFSGPGLGIALTGLSASAMGPGHWRRGGLGGLASLCVALCAGVAWWCRGLPQAAAAASSCLWPTPRPGAARSGVLTLAKLAGLGYIVTATFLPVIARAALPVGSVRPDLFWPLFGMGVAMGPPCSRARASGVGPRWLLLVAYLLGGCDWSEPGVARRAGLRWQLVAGPPIHRHHVLWLAEARRWALGGGQLHRAVHRRLRSGPDHRPAHGGLDAAPRRHAQPGLYPGLVAAVATLVLGAALYAVMVWRWVRPR